ncbi:MAG TPA: hypothetical protein VK936_09885 [Longimicrobiales bacterium]|nr:hypothetical protein [Longimicrobiales bacterium]
MEALIPISMFFCIAFVMVLRPITKKLGGLIEAVTRDKVQARTDDAGNARIALLLEQMNRRMELVEERLDFTERLVGSRAGADNRRQFGRSPADRRLDVDRMAL